MQDDARDPEAPAVQRCLQGFGVALQLGDDEYPVLTPEVDAFLKDVRSYLSPFFWRRIVLVFGNISHWCSLIRHVAPFCG